MGAPGWSCGGLSPSSLVSRFSLEFHLPRSWLAARLEPGTFGSQSRRATGLRHTPSCFSALWRYRSNAAIRVSRAGFPKPTAHLNHPSQFPRSAKQKYKKPGPGWYPLSAAVFELAFTTRANVPESFEREEARVMPVAPHELQGIAAHIVDRGGIHVLGHHLRSQQGSPGELLHTACTGAEQAEVAGFINGSMSDQPILSPGPSRLQSARCEPG